MFLDARVAALNEALVACDQLSEHYADSAIDADGLLVQQRRKQLEASSRALQAEVNKLGELPKAADPDKESLGQLLDGGKAALAELTDGLVGSSPAKSLADREQALQTLIREQLSKPLDTPLSCQASDVLEAAVVESERAAKALASEPN